MGKHMSMRTDPCSTDLSTLEHVLMWGLGLILEEGNNWQKNVSVGWGFFLIGSGPIFIKKLK